MTEHLRFSGLPFPAQEEALIAIIRSQRHLMTILEGLGFLELPDAILCSGAIYNTVWNVLTDRPPLLGIQDADVGYFDASDLTFEAEDVVIQAAARHFADLPIPVQVRNQARVHLWVPEKFGIAYPKLSQSVDMLSNFATRTHAVAARLSKDKEIEIVAPFGLEAMFAFRLEPNPVLANRPTHEQKALRARELWPELTIVPWPADDQAVGSITTDGAERVLGP